MKTTMQFLSSQKPYSPCEKVQGIMSKRFSLSLSSLTDPSGA
jgi:hypothetical protein